MAKIGRPSKFTPELGELICKRIATGEGLAEILRSIPDSPTYTTVMDWIHHPDRRIEDFSINYARAREQQADWDADHLRSIAYRLERCQSRDEADGMDKAAQLYKWLAGKRKPKVYGEKVSTEITGEGGAPLRVIVEMPPE